MNKRGGKRPGAGRPRGTLNQSTRTLKEKAAVHGDDALAVLLEVAHDGKTVVAVAASKPVKKLRRGWQWMHVLSDGVGNMETSSLNLLGEVHACGQFFIHRDLFGDDFAELCRCRAHSRKTLLSECAFDIRVI